MKDSTGKHIRWIHLYGNGAYSSDGRQIRVGKAHAIIASRHQPSHSPILGIYGMELCIDTACGKVDQLEYCPCPFPDTYDHDRLCKKCLKNLAQMETNAQ